LDFSSFSSPPKQAETKYDDVYQAIRSIPAPQPVYLMNQESSSSEDEDEDDPWQGMYYLTLFRNSVIVKTINDIEFCSSSSVDDEPWQGRKKKNKNKYFLTQNLLTQT
jgi:hypothetical protein